MGFQLNFDEIDAIGFYPFKTRLTLQRAGSSFNIQN